MFDKQIGWLIKFDKRNVNYKEKKDDLICGLICGLIGGFICGLIGGFLWGLVWGLIGMLVWGLVWGLIGGFIWGLGSLFSISLIASIKYFPFKIWLFIVGVIVIAAELIFLLLDKTKPKKNEDKFWFTSKRKGIAYLESTFIILEINGLFQLGKRGLPYIKRYFPEIVKWIGYIGITLVGLGIIILILWGYVKVNSLKYE